MAMRMRTTLLLSLLAVSFGLTALSLIVIHTSLQQQIREALASVVGRPTKTPNIFGLTKTFHSHCYGLSVAQAGCELSAAV